VNDDKTFMKQINSRAIASKILELGAIVFANKCSDGGYILATHGCRRRRLNVELNGIIKM